MIKDKKIAVATRIKGDYEDYLSNVNFDCDEIECFYVVSDKSTCEKKIGNKPVYVIHDDDPTRPTGLNVVLANMREKGRSEIHLLTYSREVTLDSDNVKEMLKEIVGRVVVGYRLADNILGEWERKDFYGGDTPGNYGIAYRVPWNTCALWSAEVVSELWFDEMCDNNHLGSINLRIDDKTTSTDYRGMEDGLALANIISKNPSLRYKLLDDELNWKVGRDKVVGHKIKMARKNIVLSTFMNVKGYSMHDLIEAGK